jgi:hypothetical protein
MDFPSFGIIQPQQICPYKYLFLKPKFRTILVKPWCGKDNNSTSSRISQNVKQYVKLLV